MMETHNSISQSNSQQAIENSSFITQIAILIFSSFLTMAIMRSFYMFIRSDKEKRGFQIKIYLLLTAWNLSTLLKQILNIIAYIKFMDTKQEVSKQEQRYLSVYSAMFYVSDMLSTFLILWLIILIPYVWIKRTLDCINYEEMEIRHHKIFGFTYKMLKFVRVYIYIRIFLAGTLIALISYAILSPASQIGFLADKNILIIFYIVQSILCIAFYALGQTKTTSLRKFIPLQPKDYQKLKLQYTLLMLVSSSRAIFNAAFYFIPNLIDFEISYKNCALDESTSESQAYKIVNTIFLAFGQFLMHFLPVLVVLYLYKPEKNRNSILTRIESTQENLLLS